MPKYNADAYDHLAQQLGINRDLLDEETIQQPNAFFHAAEGHAMAVAKRDMQKHALEITVAELDKDVRDQMESDGEKITEALVKQRITREQNYHRAYHDYLEADLAANKWSALKDSYRQRADMLKSLISLHISGYFGEITGAAEKRGAVERLSERLEAERLQKRGKS